jgi:GTP pyrophosphokinase
LATTDVLKAMGVEAEPPVKPRSFRRLFSLGSKAEVKAAIPVRGVSGHVALRISLDTGAVPGERIAGIVTPGEGITIYPIFAKALQQFEDQPERWIDLTWDTTGEDQRFPARVRVTIHNEVGALAQVAQTIGDAGGNIDELQMVTREGARDFFDLQILLEVRDIKHLNMIMNGLKQRPLVSAVTRVAG